MRILILLLVAISANSLLANEIHIANQPDKVVVFRKGAEVTFLFESKLIKGDNYFVIDSLPTGLTINNISINESSGLPISSINYSIEKNKPVLTNNEKKISLIKDTIDLNNESIERLENKCQVLGEEYQIIKNFKTDGKDFGVEKLISLTNYSNKRLNEIKVEIFNNRKVISKLRKEIEKLNESWSELANSGIKTKTNMQYKFKVKTDNPTIGQFVLKYFIKDAYWRTFYDIKVKDTKSPIELAMNAYIFQNSGMVWKEIQVELSNREPEDKNNYPVLQTSYIENANSIKSNIEIRGARASETQIRVDGLDVGNQFSGGFGAGSSKYYPQVSSSNNYSKGDLAILSYEDSTSLDENSYPNYSDVNSQTLNVIYKLNDKITVINNEDDQTYKIVETQIPSTFEYYGIPKKDINAFLLAKIANYGTFNLTQGEAKVYFEGNYVGKSQINPKSIDDTLKISLGRDEDIQLRRIKIDDFSSKKLFSSKIEQSFGYKLSIKNNKSFNINLTIKDQIPVSKFDGAEVKLEEISGAKYDERTGFLTWKVDLDKNEKKELIIKYKVTATSNAVIPR